MIDHHYIRQSVDLPEILIKSPSDLDFLVNQ